ncbi:hypothetical protein ACFXG6_15390 [Streptomyces roseus]|uniref:hypothetical protein n=1 Tax=Streptomyces roseus TaxID=66430 RepID=UPI0036CA7477
MEGDQDTGQAPPPPGEALTRVTARLGEPLTVRLLSDRLGSRAWKIQGHRGAVALKAGPDEATARDETAEMAKRTSTS